MEDENKKMKEFHNLVNQRLDNVKRLLLVKAKEYAMNNDPFHNFTRGSKMQEVTPYRVLDGFLLKHIISYKDILDQLDKGETPSKELIEEKFGDIITYFVIQEAMVLMLNKK